MVIAQTSVIGYQQYACHTSRVGLTTASTQCLWVLAWRRPLDGAGRAVPVVLYQKACYGGFCYPGASCAAVFLLWVPKNWNCSIAWLGQTKIVWQKAGIFNVFLLGKWVIFCDIFINSYFIYFRYNTFYITESEELLFSLEKSSEPPLQPDQRGLELLYPIV